MDENIYQDAAAHRNGRVAYKKGQVWRMSFSPSVVVESMAMLFPEGGGSWTMISSGRYCILFSPGCWGGNRGGMWDVLPARIDTKAMYLRPNVTSYYYIIFFVWVLCLPISNRFKSCHISKHAWCIASFVIVWSGSDSTWQRHCKWFSTLMKPLPSHC